jgi:hypothetical protein
MKSTTLKCLLLSILATGLVACDRGTIDSDLLKEDEIGNNNIYRTYRVDYSEESDQSLASATFSVGGSWGTTVKLIEPAILRIDGGRARENTDEYDQEEKNALALGFLFPPAWLFAGASGTTYHKVLPGNAGSVSFEFVDNSGTRFYDSARIPSVSLSLSRSVSHQGFQVRVYGETEDARIFVRVSQGREYTSVSEDGTVAYVTAADLEDFSYGPMTVRVEVSNRKTIRNNGESLGGSLHTTYSFAPKTVDLR